MNEKRCTKCGIVKPLEEFYVAKANKDGRASWCKACVIKNSRAYQQANPEKEIERLRAWREAHPERVREIVRASYARKRATKQQNEE